MAQDQMTDDELSQISAGAWGVEDVRTDAIRCAEWLRAMASELHTYRLMSRAEEVLRRQAYARIEARWVIAKSGYAPPEVRIPELLCLASDVAVLAAMLAGWEPST